jgi:hypothetical protein
MTTQLARTEPTQLGKIDDPILADSELWDIVSSGDLKGLSPKQRSDYYLFRCRQEGLNPASQPFTYLVLNGKGVLYGNKTAADQLRKLHGISIVKVECSDDGEYITYEITVKDREGREDFEIGSVHAGAAKGPERANAKMKALTKAKRRATYSICGTGVLDETEVETIVVPPPQAPERVIAEVVDRDTGEITSPPLSLNDDLRRLGALLGWSAEDVRAHGQEHGISLNTRDGKRAMIDLLQSYVDAENADDEPAQGSLVDAESWPAGEPGLDRNTA